MSTYLLAGGGTAGHVNPLLAAGDLLRQGGDEVIALGTAEGLEARLVPAEGFKLLTIPKVPMPRSFGQSAFSFPRRFMETVRQTKEIIYENGVDVVVGFGGYVSAPAYMAAHQLKVPFVIHEANARPGIANRLAAHFTKHIGVACLGTGLKGRLVGMPLRRAISDMAKEREADPKQAAASARQKLGLDLDKPLLLVFGGSSGAVRINRAIRQSVASVLEAGWQVLHITGKNDYQASELPGYHTLAYLDQMELGLAAADLVVGRSGAAAVAEICLMGLPAIYVPYAVGNGEQADNIEGILAAGAARMIEDANLNSRSLFEALRPLLDNPAALASMATATLRFSLPNSAENLVRLIKSVPHSG